MCDITRQYAPITPVIRAVDVVPIGDLGGVGAAHPAGGRGTYDGGWVRECVRGKGAKGIRGDYSRSIWKGRLGAGRGCAEHMKVREHSEHGGRRAGPDRRPHALMYRPGCTHLMLNGSGVTVLRQACTQPWEGGETCQCTRDLHQYKLTGVRAQNGTTRQAKAQRS